MKKENMIWDVLDNYRGVIDYSALKTMEVISAIYYVLVKQHSLANELLFREKSVLIDAYDSSIRNSSEYDLLRGLSISNAVNKMEESEYRAIVSLTLELYKNNLFETFVEFAEESNRLSNKTPQFLADLMIKLADIKETDRVLDPYCGTAGILRDILNENEEQITVGQEINSSLVAFGQLMLEITNSRRSKIYSGDSLENPRYFEDGKTYFNKVITVPPFGAKLKNNQLLLDNRFPFGQAPKGNADWAYISNAISSANLDNGKIVILCPTGVLFRSGAEYQIRNRVFQYDLFETIVALPPRLLSYTAIPTVLLIFNRNKPKDRQDKIQFIKVPEKSLVREKQGYHLPKGEVKKIIQAYESYQEIEGFSKIISRHEVDAAHLQVERYIVDTTLELEGVKYRIKLNEFSNSKVIPLSAIAKIDRGFNFVTKHEDSNGKYKILKISDLKDGKIDYDEASRINVEERTKVESYELMPRDIILSVRGTVNKVALAKEVSEPTLVSSNLARIRVKSKRYLPEFLKLFLESPIGLMQFETMSISTTIRQLSIKSLENILIPDVTIEEQQKIVDNYNHNQSKVLEEITRLKKQLDELQNELYREMDIERFYSEIK